MNLSGTKAFNVNARAIQTEGSPALEVWPYPAEWPKSRSFQVPIESFAPGNGGRTFTGLRPLPPFSHCGHFVIYAEIVEPPED